MAPTYDAAVIGTGFGGAVSACRLAQAGLKVAVLERGRRYRPGTFPRNWDDPADGWLWEHRQGLFDVKPVSEMMVVQSAAYGGGSHIYANVHLRVPPDGFAHGWPESYTRELLDPYYDLVAYMLDITPIQPTRYDGAEHAQLPPKTMAMREVAARLGRSQQFCQPNLAVKFQDNPNAAAAPNKFGALQQACNYCGECDIGCNRQAKNTLDLNYLWIAERSGNAHVSVLTEVTRIEPDGDGYRVHCRDLANGIDSAIEARAVFLCAGAVNTTELLLRCRDEYGSLEKLSPALGHRYSGNGDYLAFAFDTTAKFDPSVGPTITTGIVYDRGTQENRTWFIFQEGGYPRNIAALLQLLNPHDGLGRTIAAISKDDLVRLGLEAARRQPRTDGGVGASSAVFLAMGRDLANGRIELVPLTNTLRIHWDVPSNLDLYRTEERLSQDVAKSLGGAMGYNPFWKLLHRPVTVHSLGGCCMADHPADGVVDPDGQVYGYPNLYVVDGAALPAATGTNPSHTIAAVAERNVERFIRRYRNDPSWCAPERALAKPFIDPLSSLVIPKEGTAPPATPSIGIAFTETMKGFLTPTAAEPRTNEEYVARYAEGERENATAQFTLTISLPDVDAFIADRTHAAIAVGEVLIPALTGAAGAKVTAGVFNLFVETESMNARRMLYSLPFYGADGQRYLLSGYKDVRDHGSFDVWAATSTLYTHVRRGHDTQGPIVLSGVLHILKTDFAHQMTTLRTVGEGSPLARAEAMGRFGRLFMGTLFDVFVRPRFES